MKFSKFSVTNFRSIIGAHNIPISNITVLVGKNNEGKSNFLTALSYSMDTISRHAKDRSLLRQRTSLNMLRRRYFDSVSDQKYKWERDFPISIRHPKLTQKTIFKLEFTLDKTEKDDFNKKFNAKLDGIICFKITYDTRNKATIEITKNQKVHKTLTNKSTEISAYIYNKTSFIYIPSIRTHHQVLEIIEDLLSDALSSSLEANDEYQKALENINLLQKPVLENLSNKIKEPLSEFLPHIKDVKIHFNEDRKNIRFRRNLEVEIDDGTLTSIEDKGDGVKSLAVLGLLKNRLSQKDTSIIAIEEPESHLHSGAIHQLQKIIENLKSHNQIVLTTHNSLFVNRDFISSNIIIDNGKATQAKDIKEIRDTLGIKVSDNLTYASFVLVVEGYNDCNGLQKIFKHYSPKIAKAIRNHTLAIEYTHGASKLSPILSNLKSQACEYHVFYDSDAAANRNIDKAKENGLLEANYTQTTCLGMTESEFEDCISVSIYQEAVNRKFDVDLATKEFKNNKKKWSDRVTNCFTKQGKRMDKKIKMQLKRLISECINNNVKEAVCKHKGSSIIALIKSIESKLPDLE